LIEQLAVGGRLVVPVGTDQAQLLKVIDRTDDGLVETILEAVHFVPLVNGTAKQ
jgi:protein-L-isoaspartate(D-aspartate) O-methyltransferase